MELKFKFERPDTIITYDLTPCKIKVEDICNQDANLLNYKELDGKKYYLPNTTIYTKLSRENAIEKFKNAVKNASRDEKITMLLVTEVSEQKAFILDTK